MSRACTKPNCDCIEKEIEKQGTECIKNYPCLANTLTELLGQAKSLHANLSHEHANKIEKLTTDAIVEIGNKYKEEISVLTQENRELKEENQKLRDSVAFLREQLSAGRKTNDPF